MDFGEENLSNFSYNMNETAKMFNFPTTITSNNKCALRNKTTFIINTYEGIPDTLVLNILAWILLIILFTIMRQQAWDYGRLALVNTDAKKRWTQIFYAKANDDSTTLNSPITTPNAPNLPPIPQNSVPNHQIDQGIFSWVIATFKLKKDEILNHSGPDAVHYLSFQQHLIVVMLIITVISIVVILPINFQGNIYGDVNSFGHTTLSNLEAASPWLWVHVLLAIFYVPLIVLIMRRTSGRNAFKKAPTRSIMITNISNNHRNKNEIKDYLLQLFPDVHIQDVQLAYNINKLSTKVQEYEKAIQARLYCENRRGSRQIYVRPKFCSCEKRDAYEYYREEETRLAGEVARLRAVALNHPLGIAFVTLSNVVEAQNIISHFRPSTYRSWNISSAPSPSDIIWENLNVSPSKWYFKWCIVNICLFLVLFFLTTPAIVVNTLNTFALTRDTTDKLNRISPLISEFLPTLMLFSLSIMMPVLVAYSETWLYHWTKSLKNYAVMTKTFGYLLFMILILPSLGLTSAQAFVEWTINTTVINNNTNYRWECIFLPDKGAFFVNYVVTAAFIGTALELIRIADLLLYCWSLITAKSVAETPYIRKSIMIEYPFGIHYAWTLLIFTMCVVYSLAVPLIMPFGMIYLSFKHFADRHNLYFAFGYSNMISKSGGKIHSTAVTMTKVAVIVLMVILTATMVVRAQGFDPRTIVLIVALSISVTIFTFMSPIKRCTMRKPSITEAVGTSPPYIAEVLLNKQNTANESSPAFSGYGSDRIEDHDSVEGRDNSSIRTNTSNRTKDEEFSLQESHAYNPETEI